MLPNGDRAQGSSWQIRHSDAGAWHPPPLLRPATPGAHWTTSTGTTGAVWAPPEEVTRPRMGSNQETDMNSSSLSVLRFRFAIALGLVLMLGAVASNASAA